MSWHVVFLVVFIHILFGARENLRMKLMEEDNHLLLKIADQQRSPMVSGQQWQHHTRMCSLMLNSYTMSNMTVF